MAGTHREILQLSLDEVILLTQIWQFGHNRNQTLAVFCRVFRNRERSLLLSPVQVNLLGQLTCRSLYARDLYYCRHIAGFVFGGVVLPSDDSFHSVFTSTSTGNLKKLISPTQNLLTDSAAAETRKQRRMQLLNRFPPIDEGNHYIPLKSHHDNVPTTLPKLHILSNAVCCGALCWLCNESRIISHHNTRKR